ncbi:MAG: SsrA-binding protein SmpB [Leptospiraceae bacterium]|nr:SsrA-binding protein SmpB [Leptospiraceae bacterium]
MKKAAPTLENKRARRNYEVLETLEAGIALQGTEVKSLREGGGDLLDSYATIQGSEAFLLNLRIQPYRNATHFNHEETRTRKLLLHRKEIDKLTTKIREKKLTAVPLKLYFNERGKVKVLLGVCRGKQKADKRETEKKKEADREMARALKEVNR